MGIVPSILNGKIQNKQEKSVLLQLPVLLCKFDQINAATLLDDLRAPLHNRLESLLGDRLTQHSIRINDQYRICFICSDAGASQVEIVDYH